jgi:alkyl hydroperoxide reductase subunit AhpC
VDIASVIVKKLQDICVKYPNELSKLGIRLLSDVDHAGARRFATYDDFENIELHSTILIDKEGRVRWKRTGGDPFMDVGFLLEEIARWKG